MDKQRIMEIKIFGDKKIVVRKLAIGDINHPEKFQRHINSFLKEEAMLLMKKKKNRKEEIEWLKGRIKEVKNHKTVYLIAENNGEIIGTCHLGLLRERMDHIAGFGIAIKQGYRGFGLGKYLMETIIKMAKTELKPRPKIIELEVFECNKPAIGLYKKMGFRQVTKVPNRIQYKGKLITEIIMHLEI